MYIIRRAKANKEMSKLIEISIGSSNPGLTEYEAILCLRQIGKTGRLETVEEVHCVDYNPYLALSELTINIPENIIEIVSDFTISELFDIVEKALDKEKY
jgi:hypothetical protein